MKTIGHVWMDVLEAVVVVVGSALRKLSDRKLALANNHVYEIHSGKAGHRR
jgi:hypothetical protein